MSAGRRLPARPSLEFEKKEAKVFLRRLKAGEPDALARARERHEPFGQTPPEEFKLADAQLIQAREYGFASWPKLVRYFEDLDRQRLGRRAPQSIPITRHVQMAQWLLRGHQAQSPRAGRALAAYAPRFYGLPLAEVFKTTPTLEEAYLVEARTHGEPSWEALKERPDIESGPIPDCAAELRTAIASADLVGVQRVVYRHPDVLTYPDIRAANLWRIGKLLVHYDRRMEPGRLSTITEWLATQGFDYQRELNLQLCGHMHMKAGKVQWLLDRGADPNWVAPSGIPVLEHALILYWNGAAVDLVAARARPRQALWIAAGLGDVEGVKRSLDPKGRPTPAATELRPPFDSVGGPPHLSHPEPDAEELLAETLYVAASNGRTEVIEYLASRGAPLNSTILGGPLLGVAVGNGLAPVVEVMLKCGADLDIPTGDSNGTPREMGRSFFRPNDPARRRVAELCGWDPDKIPIDPEG